MASKVQVCCECGQRLPRDVVALNKKLRPEAAAERRFLCLECFAAFLECEVDDLQWKIEQFKEEGCKLFS